MRAERHKLRQLRRPARSHFLLVRRSSALPKPLQPPPILATCQFNAQVFLTTSALTFWVRTRSLRSTAAIPIMPLSTSAPGSISRQDRYLRAITTSAPTNQQGQSVTFTAAVTQNQSGGPGPTGTVQFTVNGTDIGSAVALSGGKAQVTSYFASSGTDSIAAFYSGDDDYETSGSYLSANSHARPRFQHFIRTAHRQRQRSRFVRIHRLTVNATNGFTASVNLTGCSNLPSETTCSFTPATVAAGGTSTIKVSTTAPSSLFPASRHIDFGGWRTTAGAIRILLLCAALWLGDQARRRRWNLVERRVDVYAV